ncbi:LysR family transcriptional regulator [Aminobacter sp. MDW-2]|uniref:LysR family transcriptional regulator n=1 Tax=Aminobacter sp. MDW-2 TaxID=2666139 RepID=UPI0012B0550F|nr:LysR family transcriptional regulator [Aminobacter sp. MDW-2]MRX37410.1 LysR family transcriptional regulator [Aminobacter sp. MDW-2]QNH35616.1 LysR family transcriptional regulator [Aminobacter sp. MDW-2]
MRGEWLEDILAVFDTGSLNRAAEARLLTQPAFSRRIAAIEDYLGVELLDRSRKPASLLAGVKDQELKIREIVALTRELVLDLKTQDRKSHNQIVVASQHALTTSVAPHFVRFLTSEIDLNIRLRSANRDECTAMLMTKQADLTFTYRANYEEARTRGDYIEEIVIGEERFVPVASSDCSAMFRDAYNKGELPVIAYPSNVFMGEAMIREIYPSLRSSTTIRKRTETALTLAAHQLALAGVAVAWVPRSLAESDLALGRLDCLVDILPETTFAITVQRLEGHKTATEGAVWDTIGMYSYVGPSG